MRNTIYALQILALIVIIAQISAAHAWAAGKATAVVFTWSNMSEMGPDDESEHEIILRRGDPAISHRVTYSSKAVPGITMEYPTEGAAREELFILIDEAAAGWETDYETPVLDGSSWRVTIRYPNGDATEFRGYMETPPRADEIKERILKLAEYEIKPMIF